MDKNVIDHVFLGKGRMNRRQYLNIAILLGLVNLFVILGARFIASASPLVLSIIGVLTSVVGIGSGIRRAHDFGVPAYIFLIGWLFFGISNFVFSATNIPTTIYVLSLVWGLLFIFFPGTKNPNKYGEQPKDLKKVSEIVRFWWTGKAPEQGIPPIQINT